MSTLTALSKHFVKSFFSVDHRAPPCRSLNPILKCLIL